MKLALQALALRHQYPRSVIHLSTDGLVWRGELKPNPLAEIYLVELFAENGDRQPDMFVLSPQLRPDPEGRLPHVWSDGALCLSRYGEWQSNSFFVDTVVPWAAEWLFHYEIWLGSGVWMGDGADATVGRTSMILHQFKSSPRETRSPRHARQPRRKSNLQAP